MKEEQPLTPPQPELEPESEPESEPIATKAAMDVESQAKTKDEAAQDKRWSDKTSVEAESEGEEEDGKEKEDSDSATPKPMRRKRKAKEEDDGRKDESRKSNYRKKMEQNERRRLRSIQPATRVWSDPEELTRDEITLELKKRDYPVMDLSSCALVARVLED
jgi:hypothetical protein